MKERLTIIADTLLIEACALPEDVRYSFIAIAVTVEAVRDRVEISK